MALCKDAMLIERIEMVVQVIFFKKITETVVLAAAFGYFYQYFLLFLSFTLNGPLLFPCSKVIQKFGTDTDGMHRIFNTETDGMHRIC